MEEKVIELANELRREGYNFVIAIEDKNSNNNIIHSQHSIKGLKSNTLRNMVECLTINK